MIKYSKALMEKFGSIILQRTEEKTSLIRTIFYKMDWRNSEQKNVQQFLSKQLSSELAKVLSGRFKFQTNNAKIVSILKYVHNNYKYLSDKQNYNTVEYWAGIDEIIHSRKGDCEDMACLIFVLARLAGILHYQVRIVVGDVKTRRGKGGHCWVVYTSDTDNEEYVIDGCYQYDSTSIGLRKKYNENKNYLNEWWRANDKYAYKKRRVI